MDTLPEEPKTEVAQEEKPQVAIEDMAAHDFELLLPKFYDKIEECSNRQLKRVVKALVEYPFGKDQVRFSYPQETQAFFLGMKIADCKHVLMQAALALKDEDKKTLIEETSKKEGETENERNETSVA